MHQETRPRVLLADDHAGILAALQRMLEPSCDIVGRVTDGAAALEAATRLKPDVVVLDLTLPEMNGLDACRQIKNVVPQTRVVVLTATDDAEIEKKAISVGASAFVLKYSLPDSLLKAIRKALIA